MSRGIAKYCKKIFLCFVIMILFCLCSGMQSYTIENGNPISTQVAKAELALPSPHIKISDCNKF